MTDRLKGLTVVFEKDIREDDAQCIIDAILMIKGVVAVNNSFVNSDDYINRRKIADDIKSRLYFALEDYDK